MNPFEDIHTQSRQWKVEDDGIDLTYDADFLSKLVCPKTRQPLRRATADELSALNGRIDKGEVRSASGQSISDPVEEGLVPEGASILYPVRDGVPVLLAEEAIELPAPASR